MCLDAVRSFPNSVHRSENCGESFKCLRITSHINSPLVCGTKPRPDPATANSGFNSVVIVIVVLAGMLVVAVVLGSVLFMLTHRGGQNEETSRDPSTPEFVSARDEHTDGSGIYDEITLGDRSTVDATGGGTSCNNEYGRISLTTAPAAGSTRQYAGFSSIEVAQQSHYAPIGD